MPELAWNFLLLHGVFIFAEILVVFTFLHMLYQRRTPTSIISWMLLFIAIPYLSVALYFLIGVRKQPREKSKQYIHLDEACESQEKVNNIDGILRANGIAGVTRNNSLDLITDSINAFDIMMLEIDRAQCSISIATYVFKNDAMTRILIDALSEKARQGVEVRVLIDSLGSWVSYLFNGRLKQLKKAGGQVQFFMPLFRLPYHNQINLRNHRKIYLFDEKVLISGGMNLTDEYLGPHKRDDQWEDILFRTQGEAVYLYGQIFEADWAYAKHQAPRELQKMPLKNCGDTAMQVVPSGPDMQGDALYEALISAIYTAKSRIWILTPYFVPDNVLMQALKIARHKGVDVRLITPKASNHLIADFSRNSYMRELSEVGIKLVLYRGNMLHAKVVLFDEKAVMLGSVNIDNRSLLLNYEVVSFVYSQQVISETEQWMQGFMRNADDRMTVATKFQRIAENFMRILAPQL